LIYKDLLLSLGPSPRATAVVAGGDTVLNVKPLGAKIASDGTVTRFGCSIVDENLSKSRTSQVALRAILDLACVFILSGR